MSGDSVDDAKLMIVETKGKFLENPDTQYKKEVLETLEQRFNESQAEYGAVTVVHGPAKGRFAILFKDDDFQSIWS